MDFLILEKQGLHKKMEITERYKGKKFQRGIKRSRNNGNN